MHHALSPRCPRLTVLDVSGQYLLTPASPTDVRATNLPLLDPLVIAPLRAGKNLARARDLLVGIVEHLAPLRQPAGDARDREEDREHVHRELHGLVDQARVEVDVRIELAFDEILVFERDAFE